LSRRSQAAIFLILGLFSAGFSSAQETSAQEATDEQPDTGLGSRIARWLEQPRRIQKQLADVGIVPILSGFAQGTGPAPGLSAFQPRLMGGLDVMVAGGYSFRGDSFQEVRIGRLPHEPGRAPSRRLSLDSLAPAFASGSPERWFAYAELRQREFDGGIVYDDLGGATAYRQADTTLELVAGRRVGAHWLFAMRAGTISGEARVDEAGLGDMRTMLAAATQDRDRFLRTSASFAFDDRDHPRRTTSGSYVEVSLQHFGGRDRQVSFNRLTLDARRFQTLGSPNRVVALRASGTLDSGGGLTVPFYLLDTLGGDRLRAYDPYRFRAPNVMAFSAEYRQGLSGSLQAVAFFDGGRAWGGPDTMGTQGPRGSYGLGLRFLSDDNVLVRLEGAQGAEGTRFQARLGFSF
jgi:hypothetical protein